MSEEQSTALETLGNRDMATIQQRLMADAQDAAAMEHTGSGSSSHTWISIKDKVFAVDGDAIGEDEGTKLRAIILGTSFENADYVEGYSRKAKAAPRCSAVGFDESKLAPSDNVPDKQADKCVDCKLNAYKSADNGKGKHCRNQRRLAMVAANEPDMSKALALFMRVPPTSLKGLSRYLKKIAEIGKRPVYSVITEITFNQEEKFEMLEFRAVERIDDMETLGKLIAKFDESKDALIQEFVRTDDEDGQDTAAKADKKAAKDAAKDAKKKADEDEDALLSGAAGAPSESRKVKY